MSAAVHIRLVTPADLPEVMRILQQDTIGAPVPEALGPPLPSCYYDALARLHADPNNRVLLAELDGAIVGSFQFTVIQGLLFQGGRIAQVEAVKVDAPLRSQGIGAAMMRWAIAEARRLGCVRLQLTSNKARTDAHRFYRRLGFQATHEGMKLVLPVQGRDPGDDS